MKCNYLKTLKEEVPVRIRNIPGMRRPDGNIAIIGPSYADVSRRVTTLLEILISLYGDRGQKNENDKIMT
jgi:hypothetical protein